MKEAKGRFEGLTITLKKRKLNINESNSQFVNKIPGDDYLVLGHYDQLSIKYIQDWWEWAPYHTEAISLRDPFVDKYSIKAYFPEPVKREYYQSQGFDYEIWKASNQEFPFIVLSVINISESYARKILKDGKRICDAISGLILKCVKERGFKDKWKNMHCAFLPTIGFSDLVLLFQTADLNSTLSFLDYLKDIWEEQAACLSNAYTMIGFCKRGLEKLNEDTVGGIKLAIRFSLRDGISSRKFCKYFNNEIEEWNQSHENSLENGIEKNYQILGDADFMIISDIELRKVLPLYFYEEKPGLFHPAHDIFKYYIRGIHSEVRINMMQETAEPMTKEGNKGEKDIEEYREQYLDVIDSLGNFIHENRIPERIVYGVQIVMKRYLQLIQSGHCFDMEYIIGQAFNNLARCLEQNIEIANKLSDEDKYLEIQNMLKALNTFRERIGDYLADMQRSDSLFLEGRSLSHPSIGSATKLLFFYNGFIDVIKESLCPNDKERYHFVVVSGGTDETKAVDLFAHLNPADEKTYSLILLTMPEASLYNIKSSLFHVIHEVLHFCGERQREQRMNFVIDAVCKFTAVIFADFLEWIQLQSDFVMEPVYAYIESKTKSSVEAEIETILAEETTSLKDRLYQLIKKRIMSETSNLTKEEYFGRIIYTKLLDIMEEKIFDCRGKSNNIEFDIYRCFSDYKLKLVRRFQDILEKNHILYSNFNLMCANLELRESQIKTGENIGYVTEDMKYIKYMISLYLGINIGNKIVDELIEEYDGDIDLRTLLEILELLFKECYADCMAGEFLKLEPEHFIFSFLTEMQNEQDAFPDNTPNKLRMVTDMQYLFKIKNEFSEDIKEQLKCYAVKVHDRGTGYTDYDKLINRLQKIIDVEGQEERIYALIYPVMEYLNVCREEWKKQGVWDRLATLQKLNECSEMDTPENVYSFLHYVADQWIRYAE